MVLLLGQHWPIFLPSPRLCSSRHDRHDGPSPASMSRSMRLLVARSLSDCQDTLRRVVWCWLMSSTANMVSPMKTFWPQGVIWLLNPTASLDGTTTRVLNQKSVTLTANVFAQEGSKFTSISLLVNLGNGASGGSSVERTTSSKRAYPPVASMKTSPRADIAQPESTITIIIRLLTSAGLSEGQKLQVAQTVTSTLAISYDGTSAAGPESLSDGCFSQKNTFANIPTDNFDCACTEPDCSYVHPTIISVAIELDTLIDSDLLLSSWALLRVVKFCAGCFECFVMFSRLRDLE
ncbi:uncharacterized protein BT62DRAFT_1076855 [Guyanagaster necrorhizus]|uniref:Uncharacterized protein n=1 Tax=Guyanagaster necrorhizus TaxID=856835 RepID=A0A9P7VSS2_9AGAR|nr:uncharacterized protein BT62DRAFT_1076855 [Guyanagaster necrorhizus MCA 3950]KAG7445785.1 hypothetical protein BT62DRAFT_1076855 [Guyanagaster necrorhizus MCA 3950]